MVKFNENTPKQLNLIVISETSSLSWGEGSFTMQILKSFLLKHWNIQIAIQLIWSTYYK